MPLTTSWRNKAVKFFIKGVNPLTGVTTLYITKHTELLTPTATQSTDEASYPGYARIAIGRDAVDWSDIANGVENAVRKAFGANTGSSQTVKAFGIGTSSSGAGDLILYGTINSPTGKVVAPGDAPSFEIGDLEVIG